MAQGRGPSPIIFYYSCLVNYLKNKSISKIRISFIFRNFEFSIQKRKRKFLKIPMNSEKSMNLSKTKNNVLFLFIY